MTVDVAPIGSEDARRILRAYMGEMVSTYTGRPATEAEVDDALREHPGDGLTPPRGLFLLAREDGAVVGCAGLELQPGGIGVLQRLFVVPARAVLRSVLREAPRLARPHGLANRGPSRAVSPGGPTVNQEGCDVFSRPRAAATAVAALAVASLAFASPAAAGPDRKAPTTPGNFRVTGVTPYFAHLAWNPSTDNSGTVRYQLTASNGESVSLSDGTTTHSWFLVAGNRYTFTIRAVDPSGNRSGSASTSATLPLDRTPPTAAALSVTGTGTTHVSLGWTASVDDGPYAVQYRLYVDGTTVDVGTVTSYAVDDLAPRTTHTFRVEARDFWQNASSSNTVTATTSAASPNDTTPPATPGSLNTGGMVFQDGETWLNWVASTDDTTPASRIVYRVIVNGVLDHTLLGYTRTILYVPVGQTSRIDVVAVDEAGNESAPATISVTP